MLYICRVANRYNNGDAVARYGWMIMLNGVCGSVFVRWWYWCNNHCMKDLFLSSWHRQTRGWTLFVGHACSGYKEEDALGNVAFGL